MVKTTRAVSLRNLHFTRSFRDAFISALSDPVLSVAICSPFFDRLPKPFGNLLGFCVFMKRRGTEQIQIITRPPGSGGQSISLAAAKDLVSQGVDVLIRTSPYLHAKLYHFEYRNGMFTSFVGSANFTVGGFERNSELVAEVQGSGNTSHFHRELLRLQSSNGALSFNAWVARGNPVGDEEAV